MRLERAGGQYRHAYTLAGEFDAQVQGIRFHAQPEGHAAPLQGVFDLLPQGVAAPRKDDFFAVQVADRYRMVGLQVLGGGAHHDKRVPHQRRLRVSAGRHAIEGHDAQIQQPGGHIVVQDVADALENTQRHMWVLPGHFTDERRRENVQPGLRNADGQVPRRFFTHLFLDERELTQQRPRAIRQHFAGFGQDDTPMRAGEQLAAHLVLQRRDMARERRLRQVEVGGSLVDAAQLGDPEEIVQEV